MKREPVSSSSTISEIGYDPRTRVLEVLFKNGRLYQYFEVPQQLVDQLRRAGSVGQFFNSQVRDKYRYARL